MTDSKPAWRQIVPVVGLGIALFVIVGFIYELGGPSGHRLQFFALLASLGGLFGSSLALDERSGLAALDSPFLRVALSALFGTSAMLAICSWLQDAPLLIFLPFGAIIGATLGWCGWSWAKHVDF